MELLNQLQGGNSTEVWFAGVIWSFVGIALVKVYFYKREYKFNLKFWINDNIRDVGMGLLISIIILRMGNLAIRILEQISNYNLGEVKDFVAFMIFASIYIQYKLHKSRRPISEEVATEMVERNKSQRRRRE